MVNIGTIKKGNDLTLIWNMCRSVLSIIPNTMYYKFYVSCLFTYYANDLWIYKSFKVIIFYCCDINLKVVDLYLLDIANGN